MDKWIGSWGESVAPAITTLELCGILRCTIACYRRKRAVDGLNGRPWDAGEHLLAEYEIDQCERRLQEIDRVRQYDPPADPEFLSAIIAQLGGELKLTKDRIEQLSRHAGSSVDALRLCVCSDVTEGTLCPPCRAQGAGCLRAQTIAELKELRDVLAPTKPSDQKRFYMPNSNPVTTRLEQQRAQHQIDVASLGPLRYTNQVEQPSDLMEPVNNDEQ